MKRKWKMKLLDSCTLLVDNLCTVGTWETLEDFLYTLVSRNVVVQYNVYVLVRTSWLCRCLKDTSSLSRKRGLL